MDKPKTCKQCRFFKDDSDGRDAGCFREPVSIYRKANDPACVVAEELEKF